MELARLLLVAVGLNTTSWGLWGSCVFSWFSSLFTEVGQMTTRMVKAVGSSEYRKNMSLKARSLDQICTECECEPLSPVSDHLALNLPSRVFCHQCC